MSASMTRTVILPNGTEATVTARSTPYGYTADLALPNGKTLPCSFGCMPQCLGEALDLACRFVRRTAQATA